MKRFYDARKFTLMSRLHSHRYIQQMLKYSHHKVKILSDCVKYLHELNRAKFKLSLLIVFHVYKM